MRADRVVFRLEDHGYTDVRLQQELERPRSGPPFAPPRRPLGARVPPPAGRPHGVPASRPTATRSRTRTTRSRAGDRVRRSSSRATRRPRWLDAPDPGPAIRSSPSATRCGRRRTPTRGARCRSSSPTTAATTSATRSCTRLIAHAIATNRIPRCRVALLDAPARDEDYSASARYARTLAARLPQLAPATAHAGSAPASARSRCCTPAGCTPARSARLMLQSGSFFRQRWDRQESGFAALPPDLPLRRHRAERAGTAATPIPITLTCGAPEENLANNRAVATALRRQGHARHAPRQPRRPQLRSAGATRSTRTSSICSRAPGGRARADDAHAPDRAAARHGGGLVGRLRDARRAARRPRSSTAASATSSRPSASRSSRSTCACDPRHSLVIDRLAHWYYVPREWIKKVALMDGVYLMNNPFTFQSMEKHSAYCAMMRLGPEGARRRGSSRTSSRRPTSASPTPPTRYNQPFDLAEIAGEDRLPAVHEAVRRRRLGRREPGPRRAGAGRALRRVRASG